MILILSTESLSDDNVLLSPVLSIKIRYLNVYNAERKKQLILKDYGRL